jgi:Zn-dependent protease
VRVSISAGVLVVLGALAVATARTPSLLPLLALAAGLVVSLLLHELGHAIAARAYGYDVDLVRISVVGAEVRWSAPEPDPHRALVIAAAGPAVSAVLAAACVLAGWPSLAALNLLGATVNLVPIRGLDGWAIWRALRAA